MSGAPRAVYDDIGVGYAELRRPDPRIAGAIGAALAGAQRIVNVGAGAGSYETFAAKLVAVDLSATMLAQRAAGAAPAVRASALRLPFEDGRFDAALAILTIHHWSDPVRGLAELARVARRQVLLTFDAAHRYDDFWLARDYLPEITRINPGLGPSFDTLREVLGPLDVRVVPVPHDCTDGFLCAYWRRPHAYLDPRVRRAISMFSLLSEVEPGLEALRRDLADGTWERRNAQLLRRDAMDYGYRLVCAGQEAPAGARAAGA